MISLGADFLIHAVARYQEEQARRRQAARALRAGMAGVLGALVLASLSDGIAFLANVTSGIETIIGFGIAAGIAVLSNFVIMGILIPLVIMRLDGRRDSAEDTGEPPPADGMAGVQGAGGGTRGYSRFGVTATIMGLSRVSWLALPLVALFTAGATYLAFQLEPQFDTKDFLDADSDFVVGLDKLDEYSAPSLSGEPATIYVQGDLAAPESLDGLRELLQRLGGERAFQPGTGRPGIPVQPHGVPTAGAGYRLGSGAGGGVGGYRGGDYRH